MKIAIVTETYPPQINGVSRTLQHLVQFLCETGHDVLLIHPKYKYTKANQFEPASADCSRVIEMKSCALPFYQEVVVPCPPFNRMKQALIAFQPDIVHIATEGTLGYAALRFCRSQQWPVVSSFHTNFDAYARHYRMSWLAPFVTRYLRWFHNRTDSTFVATPTMIHRLDSNGFQRLRLWPRGVNAAQFSPDRPGEALVRQSLGIPAGAFVVGHCGRLAPEKNFEFLRMAFQQFLEKSDDSHVLIVGDGPLRKKLEINLKANKNQSNRVHFTGYLTGDALYDAYSAMNIFAFSSRTETFGNVLLEAMASGLPVIALAEGGPVDVIHHQKTGVLLNADAHPNEMAEILTFFKNNEIMRQEMAENARQYAISQNWSRIMNQLVDDYNAVISDKFIQKK